MYIVIVKFSDWQVVSGDGLCLSVEWGRGRWADGHMGTWGWVVNNN